jgi:aconitate decarboxylase
VSNIMNASTTPPAQPGRPTDPRGPTGRLAEWVHGLSLDKVPAAAQARAKHLILDGLGCALVGAQLPWSQKAVELVTLFEGSGEKTIIGWGRKTAGPPAALLNGTFIQAFELDDFHPGGPLHSAAVVIPSLMATAEHLGSVSGARFLLAAIAGFEVGPRVGMALHGSQMLSRGWHSGSVFGTHASAAAAGVLLGLDPAQLEDAFGLAGTQSAGLMAAQYEADCKRMHHGFSARNGLYSALLAAGGYTGIKRVFEREYGGFLAVFGEGHDPDAGKLTEGLGTRWETQRIAIKPYAAMGALHTPLDAIFEIMSKRPLTTGEIARIEVDLSHASYHHGWWVLERPITPIGAQMNVGYALAVAIVDKAAMVQQFSPRRIDSDDVWELIPKISARHDRSFDSTGPRGARVTVHFTDGTSMTSLRPNSRTIADPLKNEEVVDKFKTLTKDIVEPTRQQGIIDATLRLERLDDVAELLALLAPKVASPFH